MIEWRLGAADGGSRGGEPGSPAPDLGKQGPKIKFQDGGLVPNTWPANALFLILLFFAFYG